jgi:hypothetical protein
MKPRTAAIALLAALAATTAAAQQKPGMTLETSKALSWLKEINTQADVDRLNLPQLPESVTKNIKPLVVDRRLLPPEFYDRPYKGNKLTVTRVPTQAEVTKLCPPTVFPHKLGCAYMTGGQAKDESYAECRVILLADEVVASLGFTTPEFVLRHEIAHCNGWPATHIGARLLP